jgi:hypothetical protein
MGLGLLLLVSVGKENIYLSSEPEITFFKTSYKRYTNFSVETVAQYFKAVPDFGRKVTVNLSKTADLLGAVQLYVELPDIPVSNPSVIPSDIKKFAWSKKIGLVLIDYVDLEIGGTLIERQYGDYLNIWYELVLNLGKKPSFNKMIGNTEFLTTYTNGKISQVLYIPLNFWFCQESGLTLPLIALIHNDIKIHVQFNDFTKCFVQTPTHYIKTSEPFTLFKEGEIIKQTVSGNTAIGKFVYYDVVNNNLYYDKINGTFAIPQTSNDINYAITGTVTKFQQNLLSTSFVTTDENYFRFNTPSIQTAYLLVDYIYLDYAERSLFINNTHEYLVPIIQNIQEQTCYSTNIIYKVPFVNPIKIFFWRAQLVSNYNLNDMFNYTINDIISSNTKIIQNEYVVLNSVNQTELSKSEYYTYIQNYQNKFSPSEDGIHMYSFCLNPLEYQPSGTINFSKIDDGYLQISFNKFVNYQNPILLRGYGLQLNIFRIVNGLGGLGYYL